MFPSLPYNTKIERLGLKCLFSEERPLATIATLDLKSIHELYQEVKKEYSGYSERYLYFLATCFYVDPDIDLDIALS